MIRNVQSLRAVAAVMVVFVHLGQFLAALHSPTFGEGGVDLFFVISGFVMVHTTQARAPTASSFARNRIARIVPIYWLMTLSVFAVALLAPRLLGATRADFVELLKSLLFIPYLKASGLVQPVLFVGWTLNYEAFFYALFSVGLLFRHYYRGLALVLAVLFALALFGAVERPQSVLLKFYTNPIILEFGFGMLLALATAAAPRTVGQPVRVAMLLTLLAGPAIVIWPLLRPDLSQLITRGLPAVILLGGVVLLERWRWALKSAALLAVGDASYVLYLSHPYVTQAVQKIAGPLHPTAAASLALIILCLMLILALALALHTFVERPLTRVARRLLAVGKMASQPA